MAVENVLPANAVQAGEDAPLPFYRGNGSFRETHWFRSKSDRVRSQSPDASGVPLQFPGSSIGNITRFCFFRA